jgi:branched-chain amino acid transport system ATP-binding protein
MNNEMRSQHHSRDERVASNGAGPQRDSLLTARGLCVGYGQVPVVHDLDISVREGEVVALLGSNGAGKTTTLLALSGYLSPTKGTVEWLGRPARSPLHRRCKEGMGFVPETRSAIFGLTVLDNLRLGGGDLDRALALFPELRPLLKRKAGLLSGGEQQILALARALSRSPKLLILDELSLGLAPLVTARLYEVVRTAADGGVGVLLVEQQVRRALALCHRSYVLRRGRCVLEGKSSDLLARIDEIEATYLSAVSSDDRDRTEPRKGSP